MDTELVDLVKQLLVYFQVEDGDYPICSVFSKGGFYTGVVEDELAALLEEIKYIIDEEY